MLWPYGYTLNDTAAGPDRRRPEHVRDARPRDGGTNGYTPEQSSDLYITDGSIIDWEWATHKIFAYTFEMYPRDLEPGLLPARRGRSRPQTTRNREAFLMLLEHADCPQRAIGKQVAVLRRDAAAAASAAAART